MLAYLVIRDGAHWTDVFRLVPGQPVRIGRAPTNDIVITDERCSRNHAELLYTQQGWVLRDLNSRNGTSVGGRLIEHDYHLQPGDVIRIGRSQLAYVHDLSTAFPDSAGIGQRVANPTTQPVSQDTEDSLVFQEPEPTTITHRREDTSFLRSEGTSARAAHAEVGTQLYQLSFQLAVRLAQAEAVESLCQLVLQWLFEKIPVDAGAVLLLPRKGGRNLGPEDLAVVAHQTRGQQNYHPVSAFLAERVLREASGIRACNVQGDSTLSSRDSRGNLPADTVLCAPVQHEGPVLGLVHLYTTEPNHVLSEEHLDVTLAAAKTLAVALGNLEHVRHLSENLSQIKLENEQLRQQLGVESEIVGRSPVIRQVTEKIARVAPTRSTVLIRGESGVGKELVARAIHFSSPRKNKPFICLNCAALSETLLESELFGHERGAFTGATSRRLGKFELADGGTLMLDEIGEMSPQLQAKFLRVLEGHPFERVGGTELVKVDVRVIAATNRNLEKEVERGNFRRDLFFRLNVVEIYIPGLRKRPEDIPILAHYFLEKYNAELGRKIKGFTDAALEQMLRYRWPGNVRELKNVVERACVLCEGDYIDVHNLTLSKLSTAGETSELVVTHPKTYVAMSLAEVEKRHIEATLRATGWNKSQAAAILGIERSTLDRKIRRYEIQREHPLMKQS